MLETLRRWEHSRIDWAFDHPWVYLIPVVLLVGVYAWARWREKNTSDVVKLRVYRKKRTGN